MKTSPIQPAPLTFNAEGQPWSEQYADVYHAKAGAFEQAAHVFLAGNRLPQRWQQTPTKRFVILETGLGLANNFLATWQAWRATPEPRAPLDFVSIEQHPFTGADLRRAHAHSPCPEMVDALLAQWPALTPNLHMLSFDGGRVRLLLALGDALQWLPELHMRVDAFYLDGFAPSRNPALWQPKVFKALARLAQPEATVATWSAARAVRDGLSAAGFEITRAVGHGEKRDMTVGRYAPRWRPRVSPGRASAAAHGGEQHALIIGAGLAGCATAWGLSQVGWRSTVLDAATTPACGASGNPAGLFHGIVNAQDGAHSRLYRTAALAIHQVAQAAIDHHSAQGQAQGLWRLESRRSEAEMHALLGALGLPPDYVQAHSADSASRGTGWPLTSPAWWFAKGGWIDPAGLCRAYLAIADQATRFKGAQNVASLRCDDKGWTACDAQGHALSTAPVLVLCNAGDALRLLGRPKTLLTPVRGQLSWCGTPAQAAALGWPAQGPHQPVTGAGYALRTESQWLWGATSQIGDLDPAVRADDHVSNLVQWARLRGEALDERSAQARLATAQVQGRVGWRWTTPDKLPVWGGMPQGPGRREQLRHLPRVPGLWVCTGLGSRGITWSALAGQVMAALISGTACPLESSLLDAVDPARLQWPHEADR